MIKIHRVIVLILSIATMSLPFSNKLSCFDLSKHCEFPKDGGLAMQISGQIMEEDEETKYNQGNCRILINPRWPMLNLISLFEKFHTWCGHPCSTKCFFLFPLY